MEVKGLVLGRREKTSGLPGREALVRPLHELPGQRVFAGGLVEAIHLDIPEILGEPSPKFWGTIPPFAQVPRKKKKKKKNTNMSSSG